MNTEQIKMYLDLKKELKISADKIAKHFAKLDNSYNFIDSWDIEGNKVYGDGVEIWYGGYQNHQVNFDIKWLSASEKELKNHINKRKKELNNSLKKKLEIEKQKRYQKYLELKKEFEEED